MKPIEKVVEELRQMAVPELVERYRALFGRAPRARNREHLWKRCAWKEEERRSGGLSGLAKRRLEELISEIDLPLAERSRSVSGRLLRPRGEKDPAVGTVFTREWHGREVRAVAVEGGFEYDGRVYRSLSAVAKAVTGSHWSGRLFFGLTKRKAP